jgi:cytochrome b561
LVHVAFYIVVFGMVASGIGMIILSGAAPAVFGAPGAVLPNFTDYPPRMPHGLGAFLLVALLVLHAGAALYRQFIRGDGLLRRMWYGG